MQHKRRRVLIVCPAQVIDTWVEEFVKDDLTCNVVRGAKTVPSPCRFTVTSYDSLRINKALQQESWDCVILDESRIISNPKSQITKVCLSSFQNVEFKAILSGAPAPEGPLDYFCQFKFLNGQFCGHHNYYQWRNAFFRSNSMGWDWFPSAGTLHAILMEVDKHSYHLSREGAMIGCKSVTERHRLNLSEEVRRTYDHAEKYFMLGEDVTLWKPVVYTWLHRLAGGCHPDAKCDHKLRELWSLVQGDFRKEPVVIWCTFNDEIEAIRTYLLKQRERERRIGVVWGRDDSKTRWEAVQAFRRGKHQFLICQVKCLRYGADLSVSSTNVFYSQPWASDYYEQAKDRIVHPSKKDTVLHTVLSTKNSIDDDIYSALLEKSGTSKALLSFIARKLKARHEVGGIRPRTGRNGLGSVASRQTS